jgi:hypothetical protein
MRTRRWTVAAGLALMLMGAIACHFEASTANLSSLKLGKDDKISQETASFEKTDTVYGAATVSNAPGKVKVKGSLAFEDVPGQTTGPIPGLEKTFDLDGSGTVTFNFTPGAAGWPAGKYRLDVVMINDSGEEKGQKTASFTVS